MISGSLQIKNGMYHTVIYEPQSTGRKKAVWRSTGLPVKGNKTKAKEILHERISEVNARELLVNTETTFADYIHKWLLNKKDYIDDITYQGYSQYVLKHIKPYFEERKINLKDIEYKHVQGYINYKHSKGRLNGKGGLSKRSLELHRNVLKQALDLAVAEKLIKMNPCDSIRMPREIKDTYKFDFYTDSELSSLLLDIKDEFIFPAIKFCSTYGLRRSELLGLQWRNINFEAKSFTIAATVVKVNKIVAKNKTKNASSHRTYPLDDEMIELLNRLKKTQEYNRSICGKDYHISDYVFTWDNGQPLSPDYITKKFRKLLNKYGHRQIRFHELRHTCASIMLAKGHTLKEVQEWLGHSDIKTTANIYGHLDVSGKLDALNTMSKATNKTR